MSNQARIFAQGTSHQHTKSAAHPDSQKTALALRILGANICADPFPWIFFLIWTYFVFARACACSCVCALRILGVKICIDLFPCLFLIWTGFGFLYSKYILVLVLLLLSFYIYIFLFWIMCCCFLFFVWFFFKLVLLKRCVAIFFWLF